MPLFRFRVRGVDSDGLQRFQSEHNFDEYGLSDQGEHFVNALITEMRDDDSPYHSLQDLLTAVRLLHQQYGHVNFFSRGPNSTGETPIMVFSKVQLGALSRGDVGKVFELLVECGANMRMTNTAGHNAVMIAAGGLNEKVWQMFYEGAKDYKWTFDWNAEDFRGRNVSGIAGQSCSGAVVAMRSQCQDMANHGLLTMQEPGGWPVVRTQAASSNNSAWQASWNRVGGYGTRDQVKCFLCMGHGHKQSICPNKWYCR